MAVTALKRAALMLALAVSLAAQNSREIRRQVVQVATSLTAGNPADAMTPFAKSFENYGRLSDYFAALTSAYRLTNEIEIASEEIANGEATLAIHWVLTLSDSQSGLSDTRAQDITVKLVLTKYVWRIVEFSPIEIFNPQAAKSN